jgi:hypothetical protein
MTRMIRATQKFEAEEGPHSLLIEKKEERLRISLYHDGIMVGAEKSPNQKMRFEVESNQEAYKKLLPILMGKLPEDVRNKFS